MNPKKLRLLAECLERNFITEEDRKSWVNDLRTFAKDIERVLQSDREIYLEDLAAQNLLKRVKKLREAGS